MTVGQSNKSYTDFIGRTYRYLQEDPLWPFGFGLSFTSFSVVLEQDISGHSDSHKNNNDGAMHVTVSPLSLCPTSPLFKPSA